MAKNTDSVRINLYVSPKYLEFFDAFAKDLHLTRSSAFSVMVRDYMRMADTKALMAEGNELISKVEELKSLIPNA